MTRNRVGRGLRRLLTLALAVMPLVSCATPAQRRALAGVGIAAAGAAAWVLSGVVGDAVFPNRIDDKSQQDTNNLFVVLYSSAVGAALGTGITLAIPNIQRWIEENKAGEIVVRQPKEDKKKDKKTEKRKLAAAGKKQRLAGQKKPAAAEEKPAAAGQEKPAEPQHEAPAPAQRFVARRTEPAMPELLGGEDHLFWTGRGWSNYIEDARLFESEEEALALIDPKWAGRTEAVDFEEARK